MPRVVITGVGVVSPIGISRDSFWNNLVAGRSGVDFLSAFPNMDLPSKIAAEVRDFDPLDYLKHKKMLKVMSRDIQLGVSSAAMAMEDSGLESGDFDPDRMGVEFGAGRISITPSELAEAAAACAGRTESFEYTRWGEDSMGNIAPLWLLKHLPNMPACHVAIEHDARGPNNTITSRDSSALLALDEAVGVIQRGAADVMIVGACSSNIHPVNIARLTLFDSLSRRTDDPTRACRPFDMDRDGSIVGEGAASFIIERYEHAVARGADIYAEILGVAAGCDGSAGGGMGIVRAVQAALKKSRLEPHELGHINAHGKSTQEDDLVEARAYHRALGSAAERIPVTGMKSYFGNFDAGSGAVELAGSVLALRYGQVPMTLNYETPDPKCRLNVIHGEPYRLRTHTALSVNRTDAGQSAAAILRAI
ncbi:MAG TPA: beta-ketoacyl-[acyl-carrier-protein] synthase family protein [Planctomycetaceae bacterium]|nr:beta-ketoacyl-[acyl-carrier-protein] synthase family protein [Planctomycetaceae bacterium]